MFNVKGIYPTKAAAEAAKEEIMSSYENHGHGDIITGGTWQDEISIVIKQTELFD